jgi:hypothetical protein
MKVHPVFHISQLKEYHRADDGRELPPPPPVEIDEYLEYEVDRILDQRTFRRRKQYLVLWKGYPLHDATWEYEEHLGNAAEALQEFLSSVEEETPLLRRRRV